MDPIGTVEIELSNYPTKQEMQSAIAAALQEAKQYTDIKVTGVLNDSY